MIAGDAKNRFLSNYGIFIDPFARFRESDIRRGFSF